MEWSLQKGPFPLVRTLFIVYSQTLLISNSKFNPMLKSTLNELILINNDRILGYEQAVQQSTDKSLQPLFTEMIEQSQQFVVQLNELANQYEIELETGTTLKGKIYRTWMDVKAAFGGGDYDDILKTCEFGEEAAQRAYVCALEDEDLDSTSRDLILAQKRLLKTSEEKIKERVGRN